MMLVYMPVQKLLRGMVLRLKGRWFETETGSRQSSLFLPVHPVPQIDLTSWFCVEEQLWLSLDHLPQLVTLPGMHFLLLFTLQLYQVVSAHLCLSQNLLVLMGPCVLAVILNCRIYQKQSSL